MSKENLWTRVRNAIQNAKLVDKAKKVWWAVGSWLDAISWFEKQVKKTVSDIPAIVGTELYTRWPRTLDLVNDYVYKPVAGNVKGLFTWDGTMKDNFIDKAADSARQHKDNFYQTHDFNQKANRQYGETLWNVLVDWALLWASSKWQIPKKILTRLGWWKVPANMRLPAPQTRLPDGSVVGAATNTTKTATSSPIRNNATKVWTNDSVRQRILTQSQKIWSKDKKAQKILDEAKRLEQLLKKNKKTLTSDEYSRATQRLEAMRNQAERIKQSKWLFEYLRAMRSRKIDKGLEKLIKPDKVPMSNWKKFWIAAWIWGAWALWLSQLGKSNEAPEWELELPEGYTWVPNMFSSSIDTETGSDTNTQDWRNNATSGMEKNSWNFSNTNNASSTSASTSQSSSWWSKPTWLVLHASTGERVPLIRNGDNLQVRWPNGQVYTLIDWVTDDNMQSKVRLIRNNELPF